jgi:hypothetical protein
LGFCDTECLRWYRDEASSKDLGFLGSQKLASHI